MDMDLDSLIAQARRKGASDIHISLSGPPHFRIDGRLRAQGTEIPSPEGVASMLALALDPPARDRFATAREVDVTYTGPSGARVRVCAFKSLRGPVLMLRLIPSRPPSPDALGLPPAVLALAHRTDGLVLVCGAAGSGKSTTAAAMVQAINEAGGRHIVTVEDPVEFRHTPIGGPVTQREVGRDTDSFATGLTSALRADPDVLMIGEARDPDTMALALRAAETGQLVILTLHAGSAPGVVDRVLDFFPLAHREQARESLAASLAGVIHQRLLPRSGEGGGRVALVSLLMGTPAIRAAIREGQARQLPALMETGRAQGMIPAADALERLLAEDLISPETAQRVRGGG